MIERMNLQKYRYVKAEDYSGGNKRKLSVAIALLGNPSIVLLDEPSSGMDPESRQFMWKIINNISKISKNSSILLTTHSMEEAETLATKIAIMVEGEIKTIGSVQQLKDKFGSNYELDLKIKIPNKSYFKEKLEIVQNMISDLEKVDLAECKDIIKKMGSDELLINFDESVSGQTLRKELAKNGFVHAEEIIEWIYVTKKLHGIIKFLLSHFDLEILENFRFYVRFSISANNKLSKIFDILESNQEELSIQNYSIKQISLEQIFMNFAHDVEHDD